MSALPSAPGVLDAESARQFREALGRAGYTAAILRGVGLIGSPGWRAVLRDRSAAMPTPACGALARFFMVRDALPAEEIAMAVGGMEVFAALERAGLAVKLPDGTYQSPFHLSPANNLLVVSDAISDPATLDPPEDYIIPVSGAARGVDDLSVRVPCELVVDLACGQGYHSLRSMSHARRCIATDINTRALGFARANAAIQGVTDRIEFRQGSFFEPLSDVLGQVDLLTCNPPFVMQPGSSVTSSVSPTEGDGMIEGLVRGLPRVLREGGWGTMFGLWENAEPRDWSARVRGWLPGSGCDALIVQFQTYLAEEYLAAWFPPDVRAKIEPGWRVLCERRKIAAVTYGAIVVRKRSGPNWLSTLSSPLFARSGSASEQVRAYFDSQTAMQSMWGPMDLLDQKLRAAPGWRFDPAQGQPRNAPPGVSPGLAIPLAGAANMEPVLAAFDGRTTARETLAALRDTGRINVVPDHPDTAATLQSLVVGGCLEIVP